MRLLAPTCLALLLTLAPAAADALTLDKAGEALREISCPAGNGPVDAAGFVEFGGIEQWVTIRGEECDNPVVLVVHGGPGNPLTPYADSVYADWTGSFTVVHWDQRGAGRTFGRNPETAEQSLTIDLLTEDGLELAERLAEGLGKEKLYLVAASWGSVLAVHMAKARPDLFHAYVGISQLVNHRANLDASYSRTLAKAEAAGDAEVVAQLRSMGPPPWTNPRNFGILRRATRRYEAVATTPGPESWWKIAADYATPVRRQEYVAGEDYSYLQFVGFKGDGMLAQVDLPMLGTRFEMPVFLIQGAEDLVTVPEVSKAYFDSISAPEKEYLILPRTGHDPNVAMMEAALRILEEQASD